MTGIRISKPRGGGGGRQWMLWDPREGYFGKQADELKDRRLSFCCSETP